MQDDHGQLFLNQPPQSVGIPTAELTVSRLERIIPVVFRSLEYGTQRTRDFWETEKRSQLWDAEKDWPDPYLSPDITRYHTRRILNRKGVDAKDEDAVISLGAIPNSGIEFHFANHFVKILKGKEGRLPGCATRKRRRFYNQRDRTYFDQVQRRSRKVVLNVVFVWEYDASFNLGDVWLTCPRRAAKRPEDVQYHWRERLQHPGESFKFDPSTVTPDFVDDLDDLIAPAEVPAVATGDEH